MHERHLSIVLALQAEGIARRQFAGMLARGEVLLVDEPPTAESLTLTLPEIEKLNVETALLLDKPKEPWRRGRPLR